MNAGTRSQMIRMKQCAAHDVKRVIQPYAPEVKADVNVMILNVLDAGRMYGIQDSGFILVQHRPC